jgi:hypothetical protein
VPVLDYLVSISAGLVPEPALCLGAGAAERSQETLYHELLICITKKYTKRCISLFPFSLNIKKFIFFTAGYTHVKI